jgi:hypothetical protein
MDSDPLFLAGVGASGLGLWAVFTWWCSTVVGFQAIGALMVVGLVFPAATPLLEPASAKDVAFDRRAYRRDLRLSTCCCHIAPTLPSGPCIVLLAILPAPYCSAAEWPAAPPIPLIPY